MFQEAWIPIIKKGGYKEFKLYNLEEDPGQQNDLSKKYPEVLDKLKKKMLEINASIMAEGEDWHLAK